MEYRAVTPDDIAQTDGLEDWSVIDGPAITAEFIATDYLSSADLARTFAGSPRNTSTTLTWNSATRADSRYC